MEFGPNVSNVIGRRVGRNCHDDATARIAFVYNPHPRVLLGMIGGGGVPLLHKHGLRYAAVGAAFKRELVTMFHGRSVFVTPNAKASGRRRRSVGPKC